MGALIEGRPDSVDGNHEGGPLDLPAGEFAFLSRGGGLASKGEFYERGRNQVGFFRTHSTVARNPSSNFVEAVHPRRSCA
jgi:hypothetical protein